MYLCPLEDVIGNFPVWSEYDLHTSSIKTTVHIMSSVLVFLGSWLGEMSSSKSLGLVVRNFFSLWSR